MNSPQLIRYGCGDTLRAGRIIEWRKNEMTDGYTLSLRVGGARRVYRQRASEAFMHEYSPKEGDYFVITSNGQQGVMPGGLFESLFRSANNG